MRRSTLHAASRRAGALVALALALAGERAAASGVDRRAVEERSVIVVFREFPEAPERALVERLGGGVQHRYTVVPAMTVRLPASAVAALRADPLVAHVEEDVALRVVPAAPGASGAGTYAAGWDVERVGAGELQRQGIRGAGVKVAVLDTGIDCTHPQLAADCHAGHNFVVGADPAHPLDPADTMDDSYDSHGTHVAGIIGARDDGSGVVGVAPEASLYAVKVADGAGFSSTAWVTAGIDWAVANGMDVVNMSFGTTNASESPALERFCTAARAAGVVLVAATSDGATSPPAYPAALGSVLGVSATDDVDHLASFSPTAAGIELVAPGVAITSTVRGGGHAVLSGTSQAAPHVSGVAALLLSAGVVSGRSREARTADMVVQALEGGAMDLGPPGRDPDYGFGLVQGPGGLQTLRDEVAAGRAAPSGGCSSGGEGAAAPTLLALLAAARRRRRRAGAVPTPTAQHEGERTSR